MSQFRKTVESFLNRADAFELQQLYRIVTDAAMQNAEPAWKSASREKRACWFSTEFLLGRVIYSNLYNLGLLHDLVQAFERNGINPALFEEIEDAALGHGGLGRLSACFLDSAATVGLPLDGYGIRYKYGLFKQYIRNGFQYETADDWTRYGDPWSRRREDEKVLIRFRKQSVWAVPYDMPIIGYGGKTVNNLRLWQSEPVNGFDFYQFNNQKYLDAYAEEIEAKSISSVLYPNDDSDVGKELRLKQQYFFTSASLQSILREYKSNEMGPMSDLPRHFAFHLNDTYPSIAIPELLRLLVEEYGMSFNEAFSVAMDSLSFTNHTIMPEAQERWSIELFSAVVPEVYPYIVMMQNKLREELKSKGINDFDQQPYYIVDNGRIYMARMSIFGSHSTNGVSAIHTNILKEDSFHEWYSVYPERFNNKTNGITQRRWLGLCNPELAEWITTHVGNGWLTDLTRLKKLTALADNPKALQQFFDIKHMNKERLADYVSAHESGFMLNVDAIFDVQVKRLHEYKRQLLNAFSIMDIYFQIKDGNLPEFYPTSFIFGAKAAPGYFRAKGIIKYINEIAELINNDSDMNGKLQVLFVQDYNVSYAEKIIPAVEVSEQLSLAGTEASGIPYVETKLRINEAYKDKMKFTRQCLLNTANSGAFSSDNSIRQYAEEIWHL